MLKMTRSIKILRILKTARSQIKNNKRKRKNLSYMMTYPVMQIYPTEHLMIFCMDLIKRKLQALICSIPQLISETNLRKYTTSVWLMQENSTLTTQLEIRGR
jgi:hypothetical protein